MLEIPKKNARPEKTLSDHQNFRLPVEPHEIISLYIGGAGVNIGNEISDLMC